MKPKAWLCAISVVALLLGCATPDTRTFVPKQCQRGGCETTVKVAVVSGTPRLSIDDPDMKMKKNDRNPVITWMLDAPDGFEFRGDSIRPHTAAPSSGKQTTTQAVWDSQIRHLANSTTRYIVQNRNDRSVTLYYDVMVYDPSGVAWPLDPAIMNDP